MKSKKLVVALLIFAVSLGLIMPVKQLFASPYTRYVLPTPDGGKLFLFAGASYDSLSLLLAETYKDSLTLQKILDRLSREINYPIINPKPIPDPKPTPTPDPTPIPEPSPGLDIDIKAEEKLMVELVNQERSKAGVKPLEIDLRLVELGRMKSRDMIDLNYFGHTSPTYGSPFDMMKRAGVQYRIAGENLAGAAEVKRAHEALMQSDGHRQNILNPDYTHIGVGVAEGGTYGKMFTQLFIGTW